MTIQDMFFKILLVLILIGINAFFVTAEFSIVSVRRSRISQLVEEGDIAAQTVQSLQRSLERLLSTTQIGITLSSLALGWIGESTMAILIENILDRFLNFSLARTETIAHSLSIPIAFFLIAYLQIVLGELCPKSVALMFPEQLARFFAPPSLAIARFFNPFIWILNQSTRWLLKLVGIQYKGQGWYNRVTSEELQLIITTEGESTGLEPTSRELLNNVFEFGDVNAVEVMIPRTRITAIPIDANFDQVLQEVACNGHSRYPVTGDSLDDILGFIDFKDLALPLAQGIITPETSIKDWVRPVRFVSESTPLSELLPLMQRSRSKLVMIVDEFGGTSGLVTLQDLIAEIIGDESENENSEENSISMIDESTFIINAQLNLEEVNEILDLDFPVIDQYQTLAGFILYQFQKIPSQGEIFHYDNLDITIISAEGPRLDKVKIHRRDLPISTVKN
jgi:CBS domain containing-hemolysin-like protein